MKKIKNENEITVEIDLAPDIAEAQLQDKGFVLEAEMDYNDIYMARSDCTCTDFLDILKNTIIIRNIINNQENVKQIVYKNKTYNSKKEIVKQYQKKCMIESLEDAKDFFEEIGYKELIKIYDHIKVYRNDKFSLALQFVNDKHVYIEIEQDKSPFENLEEMKKAADELCFTYKTKNYFVKKAEIELMEKY